MYDKVTEWVGGVAARKRRSQRVAEYEARYTLAVDDGCCVYCGGGGRTLFDHVPPLAVAWACFPGAPLVKYRACAWCNEALGPHPDACLVNRKYVVTAISWGRAEAAFNAGWTAEQAEAVAAFDRLVQGDFRARPKQFCECIGCASERWQQDAEKRGAA